MAVLEPIVNLTQWRIDVFTDADGLATWAYADFGVQPGDRLYGARAVYEVTAVRPAGLANFPDTLQRVSLREVRR